MARLTRRRLFAAGGAGAAASALAACGAGAADGERSAENDGEILLAAANAELSVGSAARKAKAGAGREQARVAGAIAGSSARRTDELSALLEEAGVEMPAASDVAASLESLADAAQRAIGPYREGAALLSTLELREVMFEHVSQVAGELGAVRDLLGEEPSPFAFVTGGSAEPYEDADFDPTADE